MKTRDIFVYQKLLNKMFKIKCLIGVLVLISVSCQSNKKEKTAKIDSPKSNKLEVLLIGTFHFRNFNPKFNLDVAQTKEVDVLTEQNQEELEVISNQITKFKPDKIFIEYPFSSQKKLDSIFNSFNNPTDYSTLNRAENIQLGFRVAKKMNHKKIFAYDYRKTSFPYDEMIETAKKANQTKLLDKIDKDGSDYEDKRNKIVSQNQSVTEVLYYLNEEKRRKENLGWYLNFSNKAGSINDTIGRFLVSEWFRRNLHMYSIIQKQVTDEDKRIMVLAGSGHISIIKDFIDYNPEWKLVELKEVMQ